MTIVPVGCLSHEDLTLLGNNVLPQALRDRRHESFDEPPLRLARRPFSSLPAMNRSLAIHGESVATLTAASGGGRRGRKVAVAAAWA